MSIGGPDELDTCRDYVLPALHRAGWTDDAIREQFPVQADLPAGRIPDEEHRKRRADYVLELEPGLPLMVVEAKRLWAKSVDGIQQAMRYATKLDVPLALSTNGTGWELYNKATGTQQPVTDVPTPVEAWDLLVGDQHLNDLAQQYLKLPWSRTLLNVDGSVRQLRYYQRRAVHDVLRAMANGDRRILLVMATGSGKTFTALQLVYKLWEYRRRMQEQTGQQNYRVLYLADRDPLVGGPWGKTFRPVFGDASVRINTRNTRLSPDIYFATYQALDTTDPSSVTDEDAPGDPTETRDLLQNYPSDFFDLVIVDECHRGSARADSAWRQILEHFEPAVQLGLTATPIASSEVDTYGYFGNPVFTYSLKEGIEDGFLAPYTIRRVVFDVDADGLDIAPGLLDMHGREITPGRYGTRDYERRLRLPDRTRAMARRIVDVIGDTADRAVVFCVDAEHAATMVRELRNLRPDRTRADPEWVARIMSVERDKARLLEEFLDPERDIPQIAVTSSLLSTGVDIEDLKYVIICRPVGSLPEFKQIIGRGTRLYPDKGKVEFEIMDFVGATDKFNDPGFDGPPLEPVVTEPVDGDGEPVAGERDVEAAGGARQDPGEDSGGGGPVGGDEVPVVTVNEPEAPYAGGGSSDDRPSRTAFELNGVDVHLTSEGFWVHDTTSGRPRLVTYIDWTRQRLLENFADADALLRAWADATSRADVLAFLHGAHIDPDRLAAELGDTGDADRSPIDTVDRLLHLAWDRPTLTRAERARRARAAHQTDLDALPVAAREVLDLLLDRYAVAGIDEVASPEVLQVPPLSGLGSPAQIALRFGGAAGWHRARAEAQRWLYSA